MRDFLYSLLYIYLIPRDLIVLTLVYFMTLWLNIVNWFKGTGIKHQVVLNLRVSGGGERDKTL